MANTHQVKYVDGFVLVVPKKNLKAYQNMATGGGKLWMKHGALEYKECAGDDLTPTGHAPVLLFKKMTKAKPSETVVFSYIGYKSRAHRDAVNKKVIKEMEKYATDPKYKDQSMPFDLKRMAYGGFKVIVDGK